MKTNQAVGAAVHDQNWQLELGKFFASVIFDRAEPFDREPGKQFSADVRHTGEGALQNQPRARLAHGQFTGDAASQRFTESDDIGRGKPLSLQPLVGGLRIEVSPLLARPSFATPVTAIIE